MIICRAVKDTDTLRSLCLTSRYYRNVAQPILFEHIVIYGTLLPSLIRSLRHRPQRVRSISVQSCYCNVEETLEVCIEAGDESLHRSSRVKEVLQKPQSDKLSSVAWTILVEQMLFLVPDLEALTIISDYTQQIMYHDRTTDPLDGFLPCLRQLTYISPMKRGSLFVVSNLLNVCPVENFTAVGMAGLKPDWLAHFDLPDFNSIRNLRCRDVYLHELPELRPLIHACPQLNDFQYCLTPKPEGYERHGPRSIVALKSLFPP